MDIKKLSNKYKEEIINLRRDFHMHPEPSREEFNTSKKIKQELDKLNIPYTSVAETGIIATIQGAREGKTVALRADIDALSVTEDNDLDYKSKNKGLMHACGHDCHISMLLGAAKVLTEVKNKLKGTVKLFFQPAEEIAFGAKAMIDAGALEEVDGVFAIHVWSDIEQGKVSIEEGPRMASADIFTIKVTGQGGHGSAPHQGIDAVVASSAIVMNLQSIVSRELDPNESTVVSVGSIKSGSRFNVIASEAVLEGTTRCFNPEIRDKFPKIIERVAKNTANTYRADAELKYTRGTPVVINNAECTTLAQNTAQKVDLELENFEKLSCGEDFGEFMNRVPGVLALLGVRNENKDACYAQHHPKYQVDEDALEQGTALYAQYAIDFLNHNK